MVVDCPKCKNQLKGPPEIQGKKVRCKRCGTKFRIPSPGEAAKPGESGPARKALGPGDSDHSDSQNPYAFADDGGTGGKSTSKPSSLPNAFAKATPYGVTDLDLIPRCPHCAKELESKDAVICLNCGYNLETRTFAKTKVVYEITSQDRMHWLMPGVLCVVGIILIVAFDGWFCFGLDGMWASWEQYVPPSFTKGLRAWFVFVTCFGIWFAGRFAYKRLVLNPTPPEVEKKK